MIKDKAFNYFDGNDSLINLIASKNENNMIYLAHQSMIIDFSSQKT